MHINVAWQEIPKQNKFLLLKKMEKSRGRQMSLHRPSMPETYLCSRNVFFFFAIITLFVIGSDKAKS